MRPSRQAVFTLIALQLDRPDSSLCKVQQRIPSHSHVALGYIHIIIPTQKAVDTAGRIPSSASPGNSASPQAGLYLCDAIAISRRTSCYIVLGRRVSRKHFNTTANGNQKMHVQALIRVRSHGQETQASNTDRTILDV